MLRLSQKEPTMIMTASLEASTTSSTSIGGMPVLASTGQVQDILAALIDALTSPDCYSISETGGELTIVPMASRANG
jgi:hypothetical protein